VTSSSGSAIQAAASASVQAVTTIDGLVERIRHPQETIAVRGPHPDLLRAYPPDRQAWLAEQGAYRPALTPTAP
jgi:hypothetical protein